MEKFWHDFLLVWVTIEPFSSLALFVALTSKMTSVQRRGVALRASAYSALILLISVIVGQIFLTAMGIRLVAFQFAGGIVLFLFGLLMVLGQSSVWFAEQPESGHDIAIFPLAMPSLVGPESIVAIILLTDNHLYSIPTQALTVLAMLF